MGTGPSHFAAAEVFSHYYLGSGISRGAVFPIYLGSRYLAVEVFPNIIWVISPIQLAIQRLAGLRGFSQYYLGSFPNLSGLRISAAEVFSHYYMGSPGSQSTGNLLYWRHHWPAGISMIMKQCKLG